MNNKGVDYYFIGANAYPYIPTVGNLRGKAWIYGGYGISFSNKTFAVYGIDGITD